MNNAFQKLQRKVSPAEVEKLRKLNTALKQCLTDIHDFAWKNKFSQYCIELISSSIKEEDRWDKTEGLYVGGFGMSTSCFSDEQQRVLKSLLHVKPSYSTYYMLGHYLFETPLTIDNLLSVDIIHAYKFDRYCKTTHSEDGAIRFVYDASAALWRDGNQSK